ncbi:MAG TPA: DUF1572 family protein [Thermoanaerobaculia bacterium]|nr:DUF1572 family protein [Thermoanaerobaculia bacterium]
MNEIDYRDEAARQFRGLKKAADRALAQVSDADFFAAIDPESNSIALIVKHLAGNMRSRFTDFLTSDGEKADRHRDSEFEVEPGDTRESLLARWEEGWKITAAAIEPLTPEDFDRTVPIRGEPHTLLRAINRQLVHYAYHVGQIVLLAKHFAGPKWQTLSIPRGKSEEVNKGGR